MVMNKSIAKFAILSIIFTLALSVNYLFAAWTGPTAPPPGNNTPTPVNVGTVNQVKDGSLGLNGLSVFGSGYFQNRVGINVPIVKEIIDGKETSVAKISTDGDRDLNLDIEGAVGAKYYCDENGNNCITAAALAALIAEGGGDTTIISSDATDCNNVGGNWRDDQGVCYVPGSCPSGWTPKEKYSTTQNSTCGEVVLCIYEGSADRSSSVCSTGRHIRENSSIETCIYDVCVSYGNQPIGEVCSASQTEIGCVKN
jgi:hypothetical protein